MLRIDSAVQIVLNVVLCGFPYSRKHRVLSDRVSERPFVALIAPRDKIVSALFGFAGKNSRFAVVKGFLHPRFLVVFVVHKRNGVLFFIRSIVVEFAVEQIFQPFLLRAVVVGIFLYILLIRAFCRFSRF